MSTVTASWVRSVGQVVEIGAASGMLAGLIMLVVQMGLSTVAGGGPAGPLRLAASLALGPLAVSAEYPIAGAALVGLAVNTVLAALFGSGFVLALNGRGQLRAPVAGLILLGLAYGALLWVVDLLILGTLVFPQFTVAGLLLPGLLGHAVFYGASLALGVAWLRER